MNPTKPRSGRSWTAIAVALVLATALAGCGGEPPPECELITREGYEITITKLDGSQETRQVYPSPEGMDADGDEVDDCVEFLNGTDPNDADTSGNGLLDGRNVTLSSGDPRGESWIERGIVHEEAEGGGLVFVGLAEYGLNPTRQDHAGDGILDGEEVGGFDVWILGKAHRVRTDPRVTDTSGDGLADAKKRDMGLDPTKRDTNGDGVQDTEDINPWVEFKARLEVVSLNLTSDPFGRNNEVPLTLHLGMPDVQETKSGSARVGGTTHGEPFSTGTLDPSDRGGNIFRGVQNISFDITVTTQSGQQQRRVDLFSLTTGQEYLPGAVHGLSAGLHQGASREDPWPSGATFEGAHGDITLRIVPVWPEPWQECIDNGCRHGDGDFPWR